MSPHLTNELGVAWSAWGEFVADAAGSVDVTTAPSEAGTYTGTDAAGLLWSMQPPGGVDRRFQIEARHVMHTAGRPAVDPLKPLRYTIVAATRDGLRAEASLVLHRLADGVDTSDAPVLASLGYDVLSFAYEHLPQRLRAMRFAYPVEHLE